MTLLPEKITIGSRQSRLAKTQVEIFIKHFAKVFGQKNKSKIELKFFKTSGDNFLKDNSKFGVKGIFTKEIDEAQLRNEIDISIHSLKDLPSKMSDNLILACVLKRADPRDALFSIDQDNIKGLKKKSIIGTSSIRRSIQMKKILPSAIIKPLRGNVDTRLKKIESGKYDAIILAAAGVKRLKIKKKFSLININTIVPAVGQGIIGIVVRKNKKLICDIVSKLNCEKTFTEARCERLFLETLDGSCKTPIGGFAKIVENYYPQKIDFTYMASSEDSEKFYKGKRTFNLEKFEDEVVQLGLELKKKIKV
ncbi:MAG: Porphobilinogen deaminase [Alphaproteobacteria bacterium MarineAlpha8_Bin1]|nr:MAG: Porphobilinogen deaminase [Alphaproteobacteria bacterium MarineAlpha8_Bin1]|tara:strand:+ start:109 stop:1032 length:924 start_codon:yes stop_codon:yes gene_type:complete